VNVFESVKSSINPLAALWNSYRTFQAGFLMWETIRFGFISPSLGSEEIISLYLTARGIYIKIRREGFVPPATTSTLSA